jgi:hypothetical protein
MFHLPDLPNVGYATTREKTGSDMIMVFMREVERDRLRLLTIVVEGREKWRKVAVSVFGQSVAIDTEAIDAIYDYFTLQSCRPRTQWLLLKAAKNRMVWRTLVAYVMPHLERERERLRLAAKWGVN